MALEALERAGGDHWAGHRTSPGHVATWRWPAAASVLKLAAEKMCSICPSTRQRQIGVLEVRGRPDGGRFDDDDRALLGSLADQAALALERVRLTNEAARAEVLAQSDELKSALLASVSHDLRTPLATIKTSVSSLMDHEVEWTRTPDLNFSKQSTRKPTG